MRQISRKEYGAAGNTERYGNVLSLGYKGVSVNTAEWGRAYSNGERGAALNTGNCGWAAVSGSGGIAVTTGNESLAVAAGEHSVAFANGWNALAGGRKGCFLICSEYEPGEEGKLLDIQVQKVDGTIIQENMLYCLRKGRWCQVRKTPEIRIPEPGKIHEQRQERAVFWRWLQEKAGKLSEYPRMIQNLCFEHEISSTGKRNISRNRMGGIQSSGSGSIAVQDSCYPGNLSSVLGSRSILLHRADLGLALAGSCQTTVIRTGHAGSAAACAEGTAAAALGNGCKVRGMPGTYLIAAEYDPEEGYIKDIQIRKVDGKEILPDTYYVLYEGKFIEAWMEKFMPWEIDKGFLKQGCTN